MEIVKYINGKTERGTDINLLFSNWRCRDEKIVVLCPHDDDGVIGSGLLLYELYNLGIDVYVAIMSDGSKGYCDEEQKDNIISKRKKEARESYGILGVSPYHIKRFELPDSDLCKSALTWETEKNLIEYFRDIRATRFLLPNQNDFHLDHWITFQIGRYSAIQASEGIAPDLGEKSKRDTIIRYGVWSTFDGNPTHGIMTSSDTLEKKLKGLSCFNSQKQINEIIKEIEKRGPYEFFQEYFVRSFPASTHRKFFFPRPEEEEEIKKFLKEEGEGFVP